MSAFFLEIVNMSISASWIVLAVLLLRILLKKAPKWITVLLWGIVAVRLICPFSIESVMSLIPSAETISPEIMVEHDIMVEHKPLIDTGVPIINDAVSPIIEENFSQELEMELQGDTSMTPIQVIIPILSWVWVGGMVVMLAYTVISYLRVKNKIGTAVRLRENIFQSENVVSPFVLGVVKPRIYLPFDMNEQDMEHVIAHENAHIRRKDHLWKPFGFLLLTLHWFNPFIWIGYVLLCRDIELACDEKVVKEFDNQQKADYAQALLTCSVNRSMIAACPIAFGEVGVKDRVKSVLNYKKPAFWIIIVAILASVIAAVCFLTDPVSKEEESEVSKENDVSKDFVEGSLLYDLGATSIESIESCRLIDDGPVAEVYIGKEDFDIFAKYRYVENFNPKDKIHEVLSWPDNQRISIIVNGAWFTLYLPEDGRIVVQVSGSFKVYQADENNRITHEKFEELVRKYNQIGVAFRVNDALPEYRATVDYNENFQMAETLIIFEKESGVQLQKIDLPENECFTKTPVYALDVTFDGNIDLLVPSQRPASAVYFQAYVWNEKESQFIYAPTFENLPNFALDTENKLILSYRSGNMITSYGMSYYDTTKKDFIFKNSVYMELAENDQEIHFVEEEFKNGEWKIIKEHFIAGDDPYGPDKTNPDISNYYEKGSFWDLDSDKWNSYFLVDSNTYDVITPNQLYEQFLNGEIAANDNGQEKFLKDYFTGLYSNDDGYYKYTFIDMTGDGIDELCIKNIQLFFFTIENGKLNHWCTEGWTYVDLLSNGAIFYERDGAAPEHIDYQYYELDENGAVAFKTTFSWYTATEWPEGPNKELIAYPDRYWVDDVEVTKEEYEEKTKEYMTLAEDRVTWYYGTVN